MYGYIYLTTNLINDKKYIGKKKSKYFLENKYLGSGKILNQAIKKYGRHNFKTELLKECFSKEELDKEEKYFINKYDAVRSKEFYNLGKGGEGWQIVLSGSSHPMFGKKGEESPLYGHFVSEDTRIKIRDKAKNRVWIKNEELQKEITVDKEVVQCYLEKGYILGRLESSKRQLSSYREGNNFSDSKGRVLINDGKSNKMIHKEELESYLEKGYVKGSIAKSTKGQKWYTNGKEDILLKSDAIIPEGFSRGRSSAVRIGKDNPFYGKHHTEESKNKIKESKRLNHN